MYREVLVLRDVEGLSAPEVGEVLGLSVEAVKSRLHRAAIAVRERVAPALGAAEPPKPGCPDVLPLLSRHLEGELKPETCQEMERHLATCPLAPPAATRSRRPGPVPHHPLAYRAQGDPGLGSLRAGGGHRLWPAPPEAEAG
jgi:RNA polymerase sigma-70 factor (ECF subfamily)